MQHYVAFWVPFFIDSSVSYWKLSDTDNVPRTKNVIESICNIISYVDYDGQLSTFVNDIYMYKMCFD